MPMSMRHAMPQRDRRSCQQEGVDATLVYFFTLEPRFCQEELIAASRVLSDDA